MTNTFGQRFKTFEQRFWEKVDKSGDCWIWTGCLVSGYGRIGRVGAHRASYEMAHGHIDDKLCVLHACDNRACVNPNHLWQGTSADNVADMVSKNRNSRGPKHARAKLTENEVLEIRRAIGTDGLIASRYGISRGNAGRIRNRKTWRSLGDPV